MSSSRMYIDILAVTMEIDNVNTRNRIRRWFKQHGPSQTMITFKDEAGKYALCRRVVIHGDTVKPFHLVLKLTLSRSTQSLSCMLSLTLTLPLPQFGNRFGEFLNSCCRGHSHR